MMNGNTHWIIPANPKLYDVVNAFSERDRIDWRQSATYAVGDILHIYVAKPVQAILFQTIVEQTDIKYEDTIPDDEFWTESAEREASANHLFSRLRLIGSVEPKVFHLEELKKHGLKRAPQGPRRISGSLLDFLLNRSSIQPEEVYLEGKSVLTWHLGKERNQLLVKKAKDDFVGREGRLFCEACRFDFKNAYGKLGEGFIEAHHTIPISSMKENHPSEISDIVLLCSNCHRMIHRELPWLSVEELKQILES